MVLSVEGVNYAYKKNKLVLYDVSLDLKENRIFALLGHNGAGKTTLLSLISGNRKLQDGFIKFNRDYIDQKKQIAFVPETGGFFSSLTVWENLRFRYLLAELPASNMTQAINRLMKLFDIMKYRDIKSKGLSFGEKKRLALACALICKPRFLLLDEPTNGVDPATHKQLADILVKLREKGMHILLSSHDLSFVSKITDEIAIVQNGAIVFHEETKGMNEEHLENIYFQFTGMAEELSDEDF